MKNGAPAPTVDCAPLDPPYRDLPIDPVENQPLHAAPNEPIGRLGLMMFTIVRLHERHFGKEMASVEAVSTRAGTSRPAAQSMALRRRR